MFDVIDYMAQIRKMRRLGPMSKIMELCTGQRHVEINDEECEKYFDGMEAVYDSMTKFERTNPDRVDENRSGRIARGAGVELVAVNQFIVEFAKFRDSMKLATKAIDDWKRGIGL